MQHNNNMQRNPKPYTGPNPLLRPFPAPMSWGQDGVDHINIGHCGETYLGKALELGSNISFNHSIFGKFSNIQSFWYYIQSVERDDRLRKLHGAKLFKLASRMTVYRVINVRGMMLDSMYQRIYQSDELHRLVSESTLPFECYRLNKAEIRIRPEYFDWFIRGMEEIRSAIKQKRDPDFFYFKDNSSKDIYKYVHDTATVDKREHHDTRVTSES